MLHASREVLELVAFLLGRYEDLKQKSRDLISDKGKVRQAMTDCLNYACAKWFEYQVFPSTKVSRKSGFLLLRGSPPGCGGARGACS